MVAHVLFPDVQYFVCSLFGTGNTSWVVVVVSDFSSSKGQKVLERGLFKEGLIYKV